MNTNFTPVLSTERLMSFLPESTRRQYEDSKKEVPTIDEIKQGYAKLVGKGAMA